MGQSRWIGAAEHGATHLATGEVGYIVPMWARGRVRPPHKEGTKVSQATPGGRPPRRRRWLGRTHGPYEDNWGIGGG